MRFTRVVFGSTGSQVPTGELRPPSSPRPSIHFPEFLFTPTPPSQHSACVFNKSNLDFSSGQLSNTLHPPNPPLLLLLRPRLHKFVSCVKCFRKSLKRWRHYRAIKASLYFAIQGESAHDCLIFTRRGRGGVIKDNSILWKWETAKISSPFLLASKYFLLKIAV